MEMKHLAARAAGFLRKYRYPLLVLVIGIVLMMLPKMDWDRSAAPSTQPETTQVPLSQQLEQILSSIQGVGKVRVLLTVSAGETIVYQTDSDSGSTQVRKETVIITDSDRNQQALIQQVLPESYRGAIIVCQGGDSAAVKLAVVEAVSRATGLGADQISVLKMK